MFRRLLTACLVCMAGPSAAAEPATGDVLIQGAYVMTMDPALGDVENGDVLIRDGRIVAVGHGLAAAGARRIDAQGMVVLPGFVDAHTHLYVTTMRGQFRNAGGQFFPVSSRLARAMRPDDVRVAMYTGAMELLQSGVTTTGDFFDNVLTKAHGEAGLEGLEAAGIRAILYFGGPDKTTQHPIDLDQLEALAQRQGAPGAEPRVRIGLAWRLPRNRDDAANWAMRQKE